LQVTDFTIGQLSVFHSPMDGQKEEGWTDNSKTISPSKSTAGDNTILVKSITRYTYGRKVYLSTRYIWK